MTSISLPLQSTPSFSHYFDPADLPTRHSRRNLAMSTPLPNPHFVFPARDPENQHLQGSDNVKSDRPALPAFSFNPGSSDTAQPSVTNHALGRPGGHHRRQYSEFVGGERFFGSGPVGAGHANDEGPTVAAPVNLPSPGPGFGGGNRRRHAHRRSAAISSVDLTAISNALDVKPYAESAPCTPADPMRDHRTPDEPPKPVAYLETGVSRMTPPSSPQLHTHKLSSSPRNKSKHLLTDARRSDDTLSKDSRRNSLVQQETSTEKSEIADLFENSEVSLGSQNSKPRPKTADASLMFDFSGSSLSNDSSPSKRPLSAAGHSRAHKSMSSGNFDETLRKKHYMDDVLLHNSFRRSSDEDSNASTDDLHGTSESPASKKSKTKKRQKKVRSWAGSLFPKSKGKRPQSKKDTLETVSTIHPPILTRTNSDLGSGLDVDFDDDTIVVIRTPTNPTAPESRQPSTDADNWSSLEDSWKPRSFYEQTSSNDALSPVIDLDAALGPFNTPDMRSGRVPESGFSAATKRMYSGGRRGEFVGPEMRYHRRAESAPEMPPFDRSFLGNNRFATSSSLENPDVFYEEEEDAFLAATSESAKDSEEQLQTLPAEASSSGANTGDNQSEDSKESSGTVTRQPLVDVLQSKNEASRIQNPEMVETETARVSPQTTCDEEKIEEVQNFRGEPSNVRNPFSSRPKTPVELGKGEDHKRRILVPPSPDVSPRFLPSDPRPVTSPTELSTQVPHFSLQSQYSLPNSSFPSPDFTVSSEAPRSITTSSTTDRNFSNPSYTQSMEFPHASVEDVPSLTSSASTMTNTLNRVSATFFSRPRLSTDRSASFSAAVNRRSSQVGNSKRSSLASLSKLVVGPHAERSKLSYEEKPPGDEPEKARKKGRRISRLMHFWRTKDKEKPNGNAVEK